MEDGTDSPFLLKILFETTSAVNKTKLQAIVVDQAMYHGPA